MGLHLRSALLLTALAALALPASAVAAAPGTVPPGFSGANQYTETLPGAGGSEPTGAIHEKQGGSGAVPPAKALGDANAARLEALGPEGRAAAQLAAAGASSPGGARRVAGHGAESSGSSAASQIVGQLTGSSGSGGMGSLLPLLIAAAVLAAGAYVLARRRTASGHD